MEETLSWKEVGRVMELRSGLKQLAEGLRIKGGTAKYPRPVLTHEMAAKGFAFLSCGSDERKSARMVDVIMESPDLRAFLKAYAGYSVTAVREIKQIGASARCAHYVRMQFRIRDNELGMRIQDSGSRGQGC